MQSISTRPPANAAGSGIFPSSAMSTSVPLRRADLDVLEPFILSQTASSASQHVERDAECGANRAGSNLSWLAHPYVLEGPKQAEDLKQIDDNRNHDNSIENAFNFWIHWDVSIDEPQQHTNDDQETDNIK